MELRRRRQVGCAGVRDPALGVLEGDVNDGPTQAGEGSAQLIDLVVELEDPGAHGGDEARAGVDDLTDGVEDGVLDGHHEARDGSSGSLSHIGQDDEGVVDHPVRGGDRRRKGVLDRVHGVQGAVQAATDEVRHAARRVHEVGDAPLPTGLQAAQHRVHRDARAPFQRRDDQELRTSRRRRPAPGPVGGMSDVTHDAARQRHDSAQGTGEEAVQERGDAVKGARCLVDVVLDCRIQVAVRSDCSVVSRLPLMGVLVKQPGGVVLDVGHGRDRPDRGDVLDLESVRRLAHPGIVQRRPDVAQLAGTFVGVPGVPNQGGSGVLDLTQIPSRKRDLKPCRHHTSRRMFRARSRSAWR